MKVPALSSGGCRLDPGSRQLVTIIGGISGPGKIVYNKFYKNRQKSVSFSGHISDRIPFFSFFFARRQREQELQLADVVWVWIEA